MILTTLLPIADIEIVGSMGTFDDCVTPLAVPAFVFQVLSDGDDDTYVAINNSAWLARCLLEPHTVAADHERHRIHVVGRFLRRPTPGSHAIYVVQASHYVSFTYPLIDGSFCTVQHVSSSQFRSAKIQRGGTVDNYEFWVKKQSGAELRLAGGWAVVDERHKPTFTPTVLDGAGADASGGTVIDTTQPRLRFGPVDYDSLQARRWQMAIYTEAATLEGGFTPFQTEALWVIDSPGSPPIEVRPDPLLNGDYVAYFRTSATIRQNDTFWSASEPVAFEMAVVTPNPPANVTVTDVGADLRVCWEAPTPGITEFDDPDEVVIEIERTDCYFTEQRVYVAQTGLDGCWDDRTAPFSGEGSFCDEHSDCGITYRLRYWGIVGGFLVVTDWTTTT